MDSKYFHTLVVATTIFLSGCVANEKQITEEGNTPLTRSQLEALFSQTKETRWKNAKGTTGVATMYANHLIEVKWNGGSAQGKWDIRGNNYCDVFDNRDRKEKCRTVYKTGENEYTLFENGEFSSRFIFSE